ncbi:hypothetical protein J5N97_029295 [Dioscorea zingiberensis]|uniref:DUF4005 domain-containing protein n=1 Tax=Dioscorea zingiberensis TaxID=325984 RepID=A0A9D5H5P3_9LILI|nr:hypothetical protein J5N97_029295 [Dioscorea zingiberensis]
MGKSSSSCLKIITCGAGDSSENEELAPSEAKSSSEKRKWSFRKKSAGHRVLSNSVSSETVSASFSKETLEATATSFDSPIHLSIPEKTHVEVKPRETSPFPSDVNYEEAYAQVADGNSRTVDDNKQDSIAVVIQAGVRGYLAQKELVKLKNVVKLQSVIRGHLVRRQAVATLRCVRAIVKIQAIVRVHLACQSVQKSATEEDKKPRSDSGRSALLRKGNSCIKKGRTHSSIQILLSNGFGQQLLESVPKTKTIKVKCDSLRSDSAWKWLERWMAVTSSSVQEHNLPQDNQDVPEDANLAAPRASNEVPATDAYPNESATPEDCDASLISNTLGSFEFKVPYNSSSSIEKVDRDNSHLEDRFLGVTQSKHTKTEDIMQESSHSLSDQKPLQSDENDISQSAPDVETNKTETQSNSPKHDNKREPSDSEGKRFSFSSRRACNPAFIAVQSKFEELSSAQSGGRSIKSVSQDSAVQSKSDSVHCQVDPSIKTKDHTLLENSTADSRIQMASSECGTEISISSTLDSPDRSEAEGGEIVLEIGAAGKGNYAANNGDNVFNHANLNSEANKSSFDQETHQTQTNSEGDGSKSGLTGAGDSVVQVDNQQIEPTTSDIQTHMEKLGDQLVYRSSPEGSPRSHATALESHGTPSSQISIATKKSKKGSNIPARKQKSQTVVTRSPSTPNSDSGGRNSREHLPKDTKNGKRSSLGAAKPDTVDHEPRISNSSSLPSYMQATESARAKAHASISPKSSPDVQDKDYPKKRHSLPIANGKQDSSPRMQRSTSQAQNVKGNATHSPHNSAERRWQR